MRSIETIRRRWTSKFAQKNESARTRFVLAKSVPRATFQARASRALSNYSSESLKPFFSMSDRSAAGDATEGSKGRGDGDVDAPSSPLNPDLD